MVSSLYDRVINSALSRLAADAVAAEVQPSSSTCSKDTMTTTTGYSLMALIALFVLAIMVFITYMYLFFPSPRSGGGYKQSHGHHSSGSQMEKSDYDRVCRTNPDPSLRLSEHVF